jgi:protein-S-isoprenylcysteine O-methyltransferase Ste14
MNTLALTVWVSAFASFGWGMLRFFQKSHGFTWQTAMVGALGLGFGVWHFFVVCESRRSGMLVLAGIGLLSMSVALFWSTVCAHDSGAPTAIFEKDVPVRLVCHGPYRFIRHQFYAAYTMFWFAGWLLSGSSAGLLSASVMLAIYVAAMRQEERKFDASPLAAAYAEYRRRAGAFFPRLQWLDQGRRSY